MGTTARFGWSLVLAALLAASAAPAAQFDCGQPKSTGELPTTADALAILRAAVGIRNVCESMPCICDTNGNGILQVSDALLTLKAAVGQSVVLTCNCPVPTTTTSTTTTTLNPLCPLDAPLANLETDCSRLIYVYLWNGSLAEGFLTDGDVIVVGQSDGVESLFLGGLVTSPTAFTLSLAGLSPDELYPILDPGSGGSIGNGGYVLNVTLKLDGSTYRFNEALYDSTIPAESAIGASPPRSQADK